MPTDTRDPATRDQEKGRKRNRVQWYGSLYGAYSGIGMPATVAARKVAYSGEIPLRMDREALGSRYVVPVGGNPSDGVTANSFMLDPGAATSANLLLGLAIPTSDTSWLALDSNAYVQAGNHLISRSWGALMPYGHFLDTSPANGYALPSFEPQFYRATWLEKTPVRRMRVVLGDYLPMTWNPVRGPRERNFVELASLTYRPSVGNISETGTGSVFSTDRTVPELRVPVRGADFWMQQGPMEIETLVSRSETHPSTPTDGIVYREALGGRVGWQTQTWGAGFSFWHMYGENMAVPAAPLSGHVPAGQETLWCLDTSARFLPNLHGYGTVARTRSSRNQFVFSKNDEALVLGLMLKDFPGKDGTIRVQYQSVDPNYEILGIRQRVAYPENYTCWQGEIRHPFTGGSVTASLRQYQQLQPDILGRDAAFATSDPVFPSSSLNRGRGVIQDWLLATDLDLGTPGSPWHFYASWEQVHYDRGTTPGLAYSACHRSVTQQMAMLRYAPGEQWALDIGVARFASQGFLGTFTRDVTFNENQVIPRLGITYKPSEDCLLKLTWRHYDFRDGNAVAQGLNDYSAQQILLELQTKMGGDGISQPVSTSY